ncbi:glycoside hydrolase superfamily [Xylariales sp. PMI_506]|nr:glycoside hydrolase superfamily [Xylariales sp. PMI_506]
MSQVDIEAILASLTLEEKASLLAGQNFWESYAIPAKGVPSIKTTDGPNGVRGADFEGNTRAACFPAGSSTAATFDRNLAFKVGRALAEEARSKGSQCLLAPTTCIHRHPLGGRNFESFSEDPLLAGVLSSQVISGVQSQGVAATIKHFVANEQETARMTVDEKISQRALREIYLRPFEIAVKTAKPLAVMTAYNLVNGTHCDSHEWLLETVLRGEWGWEGLVISDWGGTNSVAGSINAGLDLEMPGPARVRKVPEVLAAIQAGETSEAALDKRVRTILKFVERLGAFEKSQQQPERAIDRPEHRALIRDSGARGMVLLKNADQILPLKDQVVGKKIALIGFAKDALVHGGGSAGVNAHYRITPWDALHSALGDKVQFEYAKGAHRQRLLAPINKDGKCGAVVGLDGQPGFSRLLYEMDNTTTPVSVLHGYETSSYSPLGTQESMHKVLEIIGDFTPSESGSHYIACSGFGATEVLINDKVVYEQDGNCQDPMGALFSALAEDEITFRFEAGTKYRLCIRSHPPMNLGMRILEGRTGVRMGFSLESEHDADLVGEAERIAAGADYAIVFTGHDPQWETEGRDQESFHLPTRGSQDALVAAVARANPNTIVVNSTGVAVAMPWLGDVKAVVQTWFPGQEAGNSIADVLTGVVNPEGHLPVTFPKNLEDCPAHGNFPGEYVDGQLKVEYAEGVFVGYRHFDRLPREKVNFPFGHGLSYTSFGLSDVQVANDNTNGNLSVSVTVTNTGDIPGGTAVQVYVGRTTSLPEHPVKALVDFDKVRLQPGETTKVQLTAQIRDLAHFDEESYQWIVEPGEYKFGVGFSTIDIRQEASVTIDKQLTFKP